MNLPASTDILVREVEACARRFLPGMRIAAADACIAFDPFSTMPVLDSGIAHLGLACNGAHDTATVQ